MHEARFRGWCAAAVSSERRPKRRQSQSLRRCPAARVSNATRMVHNDARASAQPMPMSVAAAIMTIFIVFSCTRWRRCRGATGAARQAALPNRGTEHLKAEVGRARAVIAVEASGFADKYSSSS